jgi:hypothetical protein
VKFLIAVILLCVFHSLKFVQMSSVIQPIVRISIDKDWMWWGPTFDGKTEMRSASPSYQVVCGKRLNNTNEHRPYGS